MSKASFFLFNPTKEITTIFVRTYVNGEKKPIILSTGESIEPKYWDKETKRVVTTARNLKANNTPTGINSILDDISNNIKKCVNRFKVTNEVLTKQDILNVILESRNIVIQIPIPTEQISTKPETFWAYFDFFLTEERFTKQGHPVKQQSYKSYNVIYTRLKDFEKSRKSNLKLDFQDFDKSTIEKFITFLYKKQNNNHLDTSKKGLLPNTISLTIKRLKTVLTGALSKGYNVPLSYKTVRAATVETTEIALTVNELMTLYHLDLSSNKTYDKVRDLFLVGCYTALRYSDYEQVSNSNITETQKGKFIKVTTQKTGTPVIIPLIEIVEVILEKYNGKLPKPYSNQRMNTYIKEICEKAGFVGMEKVQSHQQGQKVEIQKPRFEMVTTHTARRTGATIVYNMSKDVYLCMKLTGHKTAEQFQKYIRNNELDNAEKMSDIMNKNNFGKIYDPKENQLRIVKTKIA